MSTPREPWSATFRSDIKEASPSKATTLDVHELYYSCPKSGQKHHDSQSHDHSRHDTVVKCAAIMHDKKISGLPVLNDKNELVAS